MPKFDVQFMVSYTDTVSVEAETEAQAEKLLEDRLREVNREGIPLLKESAISTIELFLDKQEESTLQVDIVNVVTF